MQDSGDKPLMNHWYIPISLLAIALWLFIFSAESLTDALDEDDVDKYLALLLLYNIAVICLLSGILFAVYLRYQIAFISVIPYRELRIFIIFGFLVVINLRWIIHSGWLLRVSKKSYEDYIKELMGEKTPEKERCWTNFFLWTRKQIRRRK